MHLMSAGPGPKASATRGKGLGSLEAPRTPYRRRRAGLGQALPMCDTPVEYRAAPLTLTTGMKLYEASRQPASPRPACRPRTRTTQPRVEPRRGEEQPRAWRAAAPLSKAGHNRDPPRARARPPAGDVGPRWRQPWLSAPRRRPNQPPARAVQRSRNPPDRWRAQRRSAPTRPLRGERAPGSCGPDSNAWTWTAQQGASHHSAPVEGGSSELHVKACKRFSHPRARRARRSHG